MTFPIYFQVAKTWQPKLKPRKFVLKKNYSSIYTVKSNILNMPWIMILKAGVSSLL